MWAAGRLPLTTHTRTSKAPLEAPRRRQPRRCCQGNGKWPLDKTRAVCAASYSHTQIQIAILPSCQPPVEPPPLPPPHQHQQNPFRTNTTKSQVEDAWAAGRLPLTTLPLPLRTTTYHYVPVPLPLSLPLPLPLPLTTTTTIPLPITNITTTDQVWASTTTTNTTTNYKYHYHQMTSKL